MRFGCEMSRSKCKNGPHLTLGWRCFLLLPHPSSDRVVGGADRHRQQQQKQQQIARRSRRAGAQLVSLQRRQSEQSGGRVRDWSWSWSWSSCGPAAFVGRANFGGGALAKSTIEGQSANDLIRSDFTIEQQTANSSNNTLNEMQSSRSD